MSLIENGPIILAPIKYTASNVNAKTNLEDAFDELTKNALLTSSD